MDSLTPERRSLNMRKIQGRNTTPELAVSRLCRQLGFSGYRLHQKDLPGKPDLSWRGRKRAIFVNGCFWHGHNCHEGIRKPKTNQDYWIPKILRNQQRDAQNLTALRSTGWRVLVVWECEIADKDRLMSDLREFLTITQAERVTRQKGTSIRG